MKKRITGILLIFYIIIPIIIAVPAMAAESGICGDNLTWILDDSGTLTISGTGNMTDWSYTQYSPWHDNSDNIKALIIENGVTSIGNLAFTNCGNMASVVLPDSLTSIGNSAFEHCISLSTVKIPDNVTNIGNSAFWFCNGLTDIIIGNKLARIDDGTFTGCQSLSSINIPDNVTGIGSSAFENYRSLTIISIPDSLISIGDSAFSYCTKLKTIIIPNSVTEIEADAFYECPVKFVFYRGTEKEWNEIYIAYGNDYLAESKIIFNAKEKTYHFVTNCSYSLPDITGYIILSAPVAENDGKKHLV